MATAQTTAPSTDAPAVQPMPDPAPDADTNTTPAMPAPEAQVPADETSPPAAQVPSDDSTTTTTITPSDPATTAFVQTRDETDVLARSLIGSRVYAAEGTIDDQQYYSAEQRQGWSDIGEVNDVLLDWDGNVKAVVLGVGGFLGIGEKDVAIDMSTLHRVRESADVDGWFLVVNTNKETIENAPQFNRN